MHKSAPDKHQDKPNAQIRSASNPENLNTDSLSQSPEKGPTIQKKANALPPNIQSGVEAISGYSMENVKVHYNSAKPALIQAKAYTQGDHIHVAPGEERHLPHEAWHVVQQKQNRVKPNNKSFSGVPINDDLSLEREADRMGSKASAFQSNQPVQLKILRTSSVDVVQRVLHIQNSDASPFTELKYKKMKRIIHNYSAGGEPWGIMKHMAESGYNFHYPNWGKATDKAKELASHGLERGLSYLRSGSNRERNTIKQPGYATGDQFGIAAALIIDPHLDVVITKGPAAGQAGHDSTDKAESIKQFYIESGIESYRIKIVETGDIRAPQATVDMRDNIKDTYVNEFGLPQAQISNAQVNTHISKGVGHGTTVVASKWNDHRKGLVRQHWNVNASKDREIAAWLRTKNIPTAGHNVAILWSRFSGKKGDIHLEHDTSFQGIRQIVLAIAEHYTAVIIAGDPSATPDKANKFDNIAGTYGLNVYNLTGFWNNPTKELKAWGGNTRTGQFKLYDYLDRHFAELKHLGTRSGNLEAMAMIGHNVRYMEEPGSHGAERMEEWHDAGHGRTAAGGKATGYERLKISRPPTRSGKFLVDNKATQARRPPWAPGVATAPKPAGIGGYQKGFTDADLNKIRGYLGVPLHHGPAINEYSALQTIDLRGATGLTAGTVRGLLVGIMKKQILPSLHLLTLPTVFNGMFTEFVKHVRNMGIAVNFA